MKKNIFFEIIKRIRNSNSLLMSVLLSAISICFGFFAIFGFGNSSISAPEKQIFQIKNQSGQYVHIRYHLSNNSDSKRQSLVSPINSFNSYRIQEVGRNVSFVSEQQYSLKFNEREINCNYIVYSDYYSQYYSLNRFGLFQGGYVADEFNDSDSIYVSLRVAECLSSSTPKELLNQRITISFNEREFIVKGVIDESKYYDSPAHFSKLFGDMFVLFNSSHLKEYNFTDLLFESDDETFVSDSIELIKAFKQSYVDYYGVSQSISSFKEEKINVQQNVYFPNPISAKEVVITIFSIFFSLILGGLYLILLITNQLQNYKTYMNIIVFFTRVLSGCMPFVILLFVHLFGIYITNISLIVTIIFFAISLAFLLLLFVKSNKKQTENLYA